MSYPLQFAIDATTLIDLSDTEAKDKLPFNITWAVLLLL